MDSVYQACVVFDSLQRSAVVRPRAEAALRHHRDQAP